MQEQVLITDDVHPALIRGLESLGYLVNYLPDITYENCRSLIPSYQGLVINSKIKVDQAFLQSGKQLKWVARLGSGLEIIDQEAAAAMNILVISSPEGNRNAVAEHIVGMLLCLANNLIRTNREMRSGIWSREPNRGFELRGKTLGIIGFGQNGSALAEKLAGFEMEILAYDKYKQHFADHIRYVHECDLKRLREQSDIISWHVPLTDDTLGMANADFISACKPGVILVNASRGKVVDLKSLADALQSGHVSGACLDVFENEKPDTFSDAEKITFERLCAFDQVVLSPHIAGWTQESKQEIAQVLLRKLNAALKPGSAM